MAGIVNFLENILVTGNNKVQAPSRTFVQVEEPMNPNANPFVSVKGANPFANYAKNKPVAGGYFAGYYNDIPNIVGQRLFVEV